MPPNVWELNYRCQRGAQTGRPAPNNRCTSTAAREGSATVPSAPKDQGFRGSPFLSDRFGERSLLRFVITELSTGKLLCDHLLIFRTFSRIMCGTHTIVSPDPSPGGGRCRRTRSHLGRTAVMFIAYAARGIAAYEVRLALDFLR
jgi:hypothetical protein